MHVLFFPAVVSPRLFVWNLPPWFRPLGLVSMVTDTERHCPFFRQFDPNSIFIPVSWSCSVDCFSAPWARTNVKCVECDLKYDLSNLRKFSVLKHCGFDLWNVFCKCLGLFSRSGVREVSRCPTQKKKRLAQACGTPRVFWWVSVTTRRPLFMWSEFQANENYFYRAPPPKWDMVGTDPNIYIILFKEGIPFEGRREGMAISGAIRTMLGASWDLMPHFGGGGRHNRSSLFLIEPERFV